MANENLMGQGGSYVIDPETQTLVLKERTKHVDEVLAEEAVDMQPPVQAADAVPATQEADAVQKTKVKGK